MAWLVSINGMIIDARSAPQEVKDQLAAAGLMPHGTSPSPVNAIEESAEGEESIHQSTSQQPPQRPPQYPRITHRIGSSPPQYGEFE